MSPPQWNPDQQISPQESGSEGGREENDGHRVGRKWYVEVKIRTEKAGIQVKH
jgi:hypothetical protein